jgi:hypothetical protein
MATALSHNVYRMDANSVRNMYSIIAVNNKHTAKLHHVGSLFIFIYDARKLKHKKKLSSSYLHTVSSLGNNYMIKNGHFQ